MGPPPCYTYDYSEFKFIWNVGFEENPMFSPGIKPRTNNVAIDFVTNSTDLFNVLINELNSVFLVLNFKPCLIIPSTIH